MSITQVEQDGQVCPRCNGSGKTELLRTIPTNAEVIVDVYGKLYLKCQACNIQSDHLITNEENN